MANIISKADYLKISDYYADLRAQLTGATHYLYDAAYTVVLLNDFEPTLDLQQPLYDAYISQTSAIQSNAAFLAAVRAMNNHVLRRGGYASLDAYFFAQSIQVDSHWASMCGDAGFTINSAYIL
jgi:hypothetical protein